MIRVPILMYHSVTDSPNEETKPHSVRPSDLDEQLAYLAESGFTPLTLGDLVARLNKINGVELPGKPIVLTFDDGYADFHTKALPLLERHAFPATVFLTSGWVADAGKDAAG
ncbi:polysaccharide deacetylase family protein [Nonomuraea ferruginea]